jgi:hypothetical protein
VWPVGQFLVGQDLLQPGVLGLEFLQALDVVGPQPALLGPPTVIGRLTDLQLLDDLGNLTALGQQPVSFPELADDQLRGIAASLLRVLLPIGAIGLSYQVDQPKGALPS